MKPRLFPLAVFVLIAVGCAGERPTSQPDRSSPPLSSSETAVVEPTSPGDLGALLYRCDQVPFELAMLLRPANAELDPEPAALALRQFLANEGPAFDFMPDVGWRRLGTLNGVTEFANQAAGQAPDVFVSARIEPGPSGLEVTAWGGCQPRLAHPPGFVALSWWLPRLVQPPPETTTLSVALVTLDCVGGPDAELIESPTIVSGADRVTIALLARRVLGQEGCNERGCGEIFPTELTMDLPEPLGARKLVDASLFPARDAAEEGVNRGCGG